MRELVRLFFRLGWLGFGGPIAVLGMLEDEVVQKRRWLSRSDFDQIVATCKLLPGPVSLQAILFIGYLRAGRLGGLISGTLFILPAFLLVLALSALYVRAGQLGWQTKLAPLLEGLQLGALAVIALSAHQLAKPYLRNPQAWVIGLISGCAIGFAPAWEPIVLITAGAFGAWIASSRATARSVIWVAPVAVFGMGTAGALGAGTLPILAWTCFKAGALVFGTGLAIVPLLEADFVQRLGWLTHSQFMDGLAMGQITPGPVVITATFIGYLVSGTPGAVIATMAIFLPSFFNILVWVPHVWKRLGKTPAALGFVAWAIPAVIGGIVASAIRLGAISIGSPLEAAILLIAIAVGWKWKPPVWALIFATGAINTARLLLL